ncbi:MAG TPA: accessory factor UbiK family protein [Allosphingosinicella sp.]|jgi:BMFP domain-containing protein YqiC
MQSESRFFDDIAKVLNGAAGTFAGMTREAEAGFRERMREWVGGLDMVSRDEFEAVKAIAVAAREENMALKSRIDALEAAGAATGAAAAAPASASARGRKKPQDEAGRGD